MRCCPQQIILGIFVEVIFSFRNDMEVGKNGFTSIQEKVLLSSWLFLYPNLLPGAKKPLKRPIFSISEDW